MRPFTRLFRALRERPQSLPAGPRCPLSVELLEDRSVPSTMSSISANFNPTAIPAGDTVWFNAALTASNLPKGATVTVHVVNQTISFTAGGTPYTVAVPNTDIVLTPGATTASAVFDTSDNGWDVSAPTGGAGNTFMGGVALSVPSGLPGGVQNVTWTAGFWSDTNNVNVNWKWGAAVYSSFSTDNNALNVKPVDASNFGVNNNDHAGSPEAYRSFVVAGGTGGGGNNYTGNLTPNKAVTPQWGDGAAAYPFASSDPLTGVAFNESSVLAAAKLDTTAGYFEVFYTDEHALALGVNQVTVINSSGSTTTNYAVSPLTSDPGSVTTNLSVGGAYVPPAQPVTVTPTALAASQPQGNTDVSGRPMPPTLYITDTTNNPAAASGDWQYGGTPILPNAVFGAWKPFSETINQTTSTPTVTVSAAADPTANGWNLGAGADPVPTGLTNGGYGAEIRWNLADLQNAGILLPGHTYRFYVMVHDGDQNKAGGDAGQAVYNYSYPGVALPPATLSGSVYDTSNGGQVGMANITITLTNTTTGQTWTTITDSNGNYSFANLPPGNYTVSENTSQLPSGYLSQGVAGQENAGLTTNDGQGNTSSITAITLKAGDNAVNYDFDNFLPVG